METIASWPHMATICRSFFDYTVGKRFQVMGHGIKVRSKFWDTPMLMLKPLPQYGWKLATQQTQKSAVILGMSQKYKPPVMNRGNGKSTIDLFLKKNLHLYRDFPWSSHDTGGKKWDPTFWLIFQPALGTSFRGPMRIAHLTGNQKFQDPKEPPQLMLPEVIALSTSAMVFRLGTFQEFIFVRWLLERHVIYHLVN